MAKIDVAILPITREIISVNPNIDNLSILGGTTTTEPTGITVLLSTKRLSPFGNKYIIFISFV
jgi:hypothetical protein